MRRPVLTLLVAALAGAPALADTITRTDGKVLKDIDITVEGLVETSFKKGNNKQTLPSDDILTVTYDKKPRLVDEADQAMVDGDPFGALQLFDDWADGQTKKVDNRHKWSGPYAAWRSIEVCRLLDDVPGLIERCDRLINSFADSRFVPAAYLARAEAQSRTSKGVDAARKSLQALASLAESKGLSDRWKLDANLGLILTDTGLSGDQQRTQLEDIVKQAGKTYPTVANRARVGIGETYINQIDSAGESQKRELAREARIVFSDIVEDQKAEATTMAAAYTGLGTAQFHESALGGDETMGREAFLNFMRVIVLYQEESRYVSQSMFYAMLCLQSFEDELSLERSREMRYKLMSRYPESYWAKQAQNR